jgi:hypothetical protein
MLKPMTLGALALVAACAGQSYAGVNTASPGYLTNGPAACKIRETRTPQGVRLKAEIRADMSVYGDYDFVITSYNKGGSSDISRGRYRAILTLSDARGPLCDIERRS